MKDIDFDELDKAVNSLMATTVTQTNDDTADVASSEPLTITTPTSPQSVPVTPSPVPPVAQPATVEPAPQQIAVAQSSTVTRTPTPAPAVRRSGRFMDMVNKPIEQKQASPASSALPLTPPSREGLSIAPRTEVAEPVSVIEPAPETSAISPDPIDVLEQEPTSIDTTSNDAVSFPETDAQPLGAIESPFLTDAKVEKRPLNAGTSEPLVDLGAALEEDENTLEASPSEPSYDTNGADEPPINPQVAELDSDLVAIEASENQVSTQATESSDTANQVDTPSTPLGAASIPQQYATQPSSGDQSHAAIYDASQYPEPVTHPAKSKSGWLWVLWVLLLLGVGAGGAVVLYTLGIIP